MCRSIKTLRPPYAEAVTDADVRAAYEELDHNNPSRPMAVPEQN